MTDHLYNILHYLLGLFDVMKPAIAVMSVVGTVILVLRQFEKRWPIDPNLPQSEVISDWKVTSVNVALGWAAAPFAAMSSAAIVNATGGGLIQLRADDWWYGVSLLGFVLVADLYRYTSHRLYHAVPFLWALHSFHHSAEAITFVTGARHHWIDRIMEAAFFPILAILFKVPPEMITISGFIIFLPDGCAHLNVKFPLGRAITWVNSPQWHRIHHSTKPEHLNKNFASVLPLWDILFGTAWIPHKDEYPATGLVPGEKCDVVTSIVWPFRHYVRGLQFHALVRRRRENSAEVGKSYAKLPGTQNS
jgi:sterol desaturase/sphingolipid hydroxylase (fatty acid hydroxylase superfamily)